MIGGACRADLQAREFGNELDAMSGEPESEDGETLKVCDVLESVANRFPPDSDERLAIRDAALAYSIARQDNRLKQAYRKLRLAFDGELTDAMKDDLRRHGIDPDGLDDALAAD